VRSIIEQIGLKLDQWLEKVEESIEFCKMKVAQIESDGPPAMGTHLLQNYLRNLSEDRVSVAMGMAHKK
jgi:hypothetical protein